MSTGAGPVTVYESLGGSGTRASGRRAGAPSRTALERAQRDARRAERERDLAGLRQTFADLSVLHAEQFAPLEPPRPPGPPSVDPRPYVRDHVGDAVARVPAWRFRTRRVAKEQAMAEGLAEAQEEERRLAAVQAEAYKEQRRQWGLLTSNHPETVIEVLDAAFADNAVPAVPVDVDGAAVTVVMTAPTISIVPEREPSVTPTGRDSARALTKTARNGWYRRTVAALMIATVREAFAVAPEVTEVTVVVLRDATEVVWVARLTRDVVARVEDWRAIDPEEWLNGAAAESLCNVGGRTKELRAVDLADEPALTTLIDDVAAVDDALDG